ncbi:MAG: YlxR family protein [Gaiellaceae bacterium]
MTDPVRRCAGCGRRAPQHELVRFAARDGVLVAGRNLSGRGAYTCRSLACFERATAQRGFARALHEPVRVDPALARIYTGASHA